MLERKRTLKDEDAILSTPDPDAVETSTDQEPDQTDDEAATREDQAANMDYEGETPN
ncbi:hypothetical protein ACF06X_34505 [Streptomyces sp. NPDC015346]|uniref:hypothetical protein n=1 Tax=Streptomyces sp. NPDC015346 TaxID=3364954 RepID=UPI0036F9487C